MKKMEYTTSFQMFIFLIILINIHLTIRITFPKDNKALLISLALHKTPIIGIVSYPSSQNKTIINNEYIQWINSGGSVAVEIDYNNTNKTFTEVLQKINGIMFQNNRELKTMFNTTYYWKAKLLYELAKTKNTKEYYFPIFAFGNAVDMIQMFEDERLHTIQQNVNGNTKITNTSLYFLTHRYNKHKMFYYFDGRDIENIKTILMPKIHTNINTGILLKDFQSSQPLKSIFSPIAYYKVKKNRYISIIEGKKFPIYGIYMDFAQYIFEKFNDNENYEDYDNRLVTIGQKIINFCVREAYESLFKKIYYELDKNSSIGITNHFSQENKTKIFVLDNNSPKNQKQQTNLTIIGNYTLNISDDELTVKYLDEIRKEAKKLNKTDSFDKFFKEFEKKQKLKKNEKIQKNSTFSKNFTIPQNDTLFKIIKKEISEYMKNKTIKNKTNLHLDTEEILIDELDKEDEEELISFENGNYVNNTQAEHIDKPQNLTNSNSTIQNFTFSNNVTKTNLTKKENANNTFVKVPNEGQKNKGTNKKKSKKNKNKSNNTMIISTNKTTTFNQTMKKNVTLSKNATSQNKTKKLNSSQIANSTNIKKENEIDKLINKTNITQIVDNGNMTSHNQTNNTNVNATLNNSTKMITNHILSNNTKSPVNITIEDSGKSKNKNLSLIEKIKKFFNKIK